MLHLIQGFIQRGEKINFSIEKTKDGLRVTIIPVLVDASELPDADPRATLRAALARPIVANLVTADPDSELAAALTGVSQVRSEAVNALAEITQAIESAKDAASKAAKENAKRPAQTKADKGKSPASANDKEDAAVQGAVDELPEPIDSSFNPSPTTAAPSTALFD